MIVANVKKNQLSCTFVYRVSDSFDEVLLLCLSESVCHWCLRTDVDREGLRAGHRPSVCVVERSHMRVKVKLRAIF